MKKRFNHNISENLDYVDWSFSYLTNCTARYLWTVLGQLMFHIKQTKRSNSTQTIVQERKL